MRCRVLVSTELSKGTGRRRQRSVEQASLNACSSDLAFPLTGALGQVSKQLAEIY